MVNLFFVVLLLVGSLSGVRAQGSLAGDDPYTEIQDILLNYSANVCPILFDPNPDKQCQWECPSGYRLMGSVSPDGSYVCKKEDKDMGTALYCTYQLPSGCQVKDDIQATIQADKRKGRYIREEVFPPQKGVPLSKYLASIAMLDPEAVYMTSNAPSITQGATDSKSATYRFFLKVYQIFIDTATDISLLYFFMLFVWSFAVIFASGYVNKIRSPQFSMAGHVGAEFKSVFVRGALGLLVFGLPVPSQYSGNTVYVPMVVDFVRSMVYMGVEHADKLSYKINDTFIAYVTGRWIRDTERELQGVKEQRKEIANKIKNIYTLYLGGGGNGCYNMFVVKTPDGRELPVPKGYFASATDKQLERLALTGSWDSSLSDEEQMSLAYACKRYETQIITLSAELVSLGEKEKKLTQIINAYGSGNQQLYDSMKAFFDNRFQKLGWISSAVLLPIFYATAGDIMSSHGNATLPSVKTPVTATAVGVGDVSGEFGAPEEIKIQRVEAKKREAEEALRKDPGTIGKALAYIMLPPGNSLFSAMNNVLKEGGDIVVNIFGSFIDGTVGNIPIVGEKISNFVKKVLGGPIKAVIAGMSALVSVVVTYLVVDFLLSIAPFIALAIAFTLRLVVWLVDLIIFVMITPFYAVWAVTLRRYEELGNYFVRSLQLAVFPLAMVASVALALFASEIINNITYSIPQLFMTELYAFKSQFLNSGFKDVVSNTAFKFISGLFLGVLYFIARVASVFIVFKFVFSAPEAMMEKLGQVVGHGHATTQMGREIKEHVVSRHVAPF